MNKLTLKMLAKELCLSVSTVSKAIKDSHEIGPDTKLRVNELVRKLNYVANPYASSLRKRNSKTIGVVIPEIVDSFFAQVIHGIESVAQQKGYHVLIYLTHESVVKERAILKSLKYFTLLVNGNSYSKIGYLYMYIFLVINYCYNRLLFAF